MNYTDPARPGRTFARIAIARALTPPSGGSDAVLEYVYRRWGRSSGAAHVLKAAVGGGGTASGQWAAELQETNEAEAELLDVVRARTILGQLRGVRLVPANVPYLPRTTGSTAYWVAQGHAIPLSASAFNRATLRPLKLGAMMAFTEEMLKDESPEAEAAHQRDLEAAIVEMSDSTFIDPTNAGVAGKTPAAITHGATSIVSTGDIANDAEAAIGAFGGSLETASWVLHPRLAAQIGLRSGGRGAGADLGARGGTLAGLPAITSEGCDFGTDNGTIALIDGAGIVLCDAGVTVSRANDAMLEMSDAPTGVAGPSAVAASAVLVSMFQADLVALKVVRRINWAVARAGSVVNITAAAYPA